MPFSVLSIQPYRPARVWAAILSVAGSALLGGCVVAPVSDGYGYTTTTVYTNYGYPPPPRVEYRAVAPSPYHVWIDGEWFWTGARYDWHPGRWAHPGYRPPPPPPRPVLQPPRPPYWMRPELVRPAPERLERPERPHRGDDDHRRPTPYGWRDHRDGLR